MGGWKFYFSQETVSHTGTPLHVECVARANRSLQLKLECLFIQRCDISGITNRPGVKQTGCIADSMERGHIQSSPL